MPSPTNFYPKSWQWFFYILGWFFGTLTIVFWLMMYMAYSTYDKPKNLTFFNPNFHKRVYLFGLITTIVIIILGIILFFI